MSHEGEAPQADQPLDRRDVLREQFDEAEAQQVAQVQPTPAAEPKPDAQGRVRDEHGKFAPKGPVVDQDRFSPTYGQPKQAAAQANAPLPDPAAAPAVEPWMAAPKSWKKELAADWAKLDPRYQQYVHEREQQMHAGIEPLLPKAQFADDVMQAAAPYMQTIQGLGLDLPRAIVGLMEADRQLRTLPFQQKLQFLADTAMSYGIDLTGQLQQAQPAYDPHFQHQQNELLELRGQFSNFIQQQEAAQQRAALDEIQRFAKTAEHFDEVKPTMAKLLQSGFAVGIEDAYDQALRLTPDLFDAVQSARQAATEAEKRNAANDAAKRARAAAVSVKTATPGAPTPTNAKDRRSVLLEQFDALSERL